GHIQERDVHRPREGHAQAWWRARYPSRGRATLAIRDPQRAVRLGRALPGCARDGRARRNRGPCDGPDRHLPRLSGPVRPRLPLGPDGRRGARPWEATLPESNAGRGEGGGGGAPRREADEAQETSFGDSSCDNLLAPAPNRARPRSCPPPG